MYGVAGSDLVEIKQAIAGLQKGELIIKNNDNIILSFGKEFKKIKVKHLIYANYEKYKNYNSLKINRLWF